MRMRTFTAEDSDGARYTWGFWRDSRVKGGGFWFLQDPDGYVRALASTWIDSVPAIRVILSNHGQHTGVILENLK